MGMFMASVSFRCREKEKWTEIRQQIEPLFFGMEGVISNFDSEGPGYCILSPYGDMGMFLAELPETISRLTGDYAVMATCVDSDFALMELYRGGELLEQSCIGENYYDELEDLEACGKPDPEKWAPLLLDAGDMGLLKQLLSDVDAFAEDNLRGLTKLTGLPIFDDELMLAGE